MNNALQGALTSALAFLMLAGCGNDPKAANESNFARAIDAALAKDQESIVCMGNTPRFPGEVSEQYVYSPTQVAEQVAGYARFVSAGLAQERTVSRIQPASYFTRAKKYSVHQFVLSPLGTASATKRQAMFGGTYDAFCYASLRVGKIVNFTEPGDVMGVHVTQVRYVPKVASVADWSKSEKVQHAFPEMQQTLAQATSQERAMALQLTNTGWEAAR